MKYETRSKLDELIIVYDKEIESLQGPGEPERYQQDLVSLCNHVIRPAMEEFSQVLREHGHRVHVSFHERTVEQGGHSRNAEIAMHVTPKSRGVEGNVFRGDFVASFNFDTVPHKMMACVSGGATMPHEYSHTFDRHPIEGVTSELVEQELLEMLHYGFERAWREFGIQQRVAATVA